MKYHSTVYEYTTTFFLIDGHLGFSSLKLFWIKLVWTSLDKNLCRHVSLFLLGKYLRVEMLGYWLGVCLVLREKPDLFASWRHHFIFPPGVYDCHVSSTSSQTPGLCRSRAYPPGSPTALWFGICVGCHENTCPSPHQGWFAVTFILGPSSVSPFLDLSFLPDELWRRWLCSFLPVVAFSYEPLQSKFFLGFLSVTRHHVIDYISLTALEKSLYFL